MRHSPYQGTKRLKRFLEALASSTHCPIEILCPDGFTNRLGPLKTVIEQCAGDLVAPDTYDARPTFEGWGNDLINGRRPQQRSQIPIISTGRPATLHMS